MNGGSCDWTRPVDAVEQSDAVCAAVLLLVTQNGRPIRQQAYLVHGESLMATVRSGEVVRQRLMNKTIVKGFAKSGGLKSTNKSVEDMETRVTQFDQGTT